MTVNTANHAPTATVPDPAAQTSPPGELKTADITFSDPDAGDTLTVTVTAEPADVVETMGYDSTANQASFRIKDLAGLCSLTPRPDTGQSGAFETVLTVTATDSAGAAVARQIVATTAFDAADCVPTVTGATVDEAALTLSRARWRSG